MVFSVSPIVLAVAAASSPQVIGRAYDYSPQVKTNSVFGTTGLINVPTAFTTDRDAVAVGANVDKDLRGLTASWGMEGALEVGGALLERDGLPDRVIAHAKLHLVPKDFDWFDLGVGVIDPFDALRTTLFAVASASVVPPRGGMNSAFAMRVHAGLGTGIYSSRMFLGGEVWFREQFSIIGEWDTRKFNAAFRWQQSSDFSAQAGIANKGVFVSATYVFRY